MFLLLVEDDAMLGRATAQMLDKSGVQVDWVETAAEGLLRCRNRGYDAILLDLGLPDLSGEQFLRELRASGTTTPVIVLTARIQVEDRIRVLDMGADDYLVKPFDVFEVLARLRAVLRRSRDPGEPTDIHRIGPLLFQGAQRATFWHGRPVTLTTKEFDLLEVLISRRPRVVSREQLVEALYGWDEEIESNAIEVYVHYLRRKFSRNLIITVRGRGYQMGSSELLMCDAQGRAAA